MKHVLLIKKQMWRRKNSFREYIVNKTFPNQEKKARKLKKTVFHNIGMVDKFDREGFSILRSMEVGYTMKEIHEGICEGKHGAKTLASKVLK